MGFGIVSYNAQTTSDVTSNNQSSDVTSSGFFDGISNWIKSLTISYGGGTRVRGNIGGIDINYYDPDYKARGRDDAFRLSNFGGSDTVSVSPFVFILGLGLVAYAIFGRR